MSARERFEAWTVRVGGHPSVLRRNAGGDYALGAVRAEYAAYKAARAEALEEARQACDERAAESRRMEAVCDSKERVWTDRDLQDEVTTEAAACAADIRALKDKEPA